MTERLWSNHGSALGFLSWPTLLIGIVVVRAVLPLAVKPDSFLFSSGPIIYFLLLVLATGFAIRNAIQNTLGTRPFWMSLAVAYSLWALDQWIFLYYEHRLHIDVPDDSMADPLLFLHIVPLLAGVATLSNRNLSGRKLYRAILNSLLLLFFCSFLYVYAVFPYQYLFPNGTSYALRFDSLYLLENLVLVALVAVSSFRAQAPWKAIYLHFLAASTLYALSSAVANFAIDSGGYVNGRLYGVGLIGSACWFLWIPLRARQLEATEVETTQSDIGSSSKASAWAMLMIVMISIPIVWELFRRDEASGMRTFHLLVAVIAIVCLAGASYVNEYLAKSELATHLGLANDRFRLAAEAGKSVGWEWDLKTGRDSWFGDLHSMFGIASDTFVGRPEDFYRYIHVDDRQLVVKAVAALSPEKPHLQLSYRMAGPDGSVIWVERTCRAYFDEHGKLLRIVGMEADITQRKLAEVALANVSRKLIQAQEQERTRIARELHDDIGQRLAMLTIEIAELQQSSLDLPAHVRSRIDELGNQTSNIAADIQSLSHELHSAKLEYLGIAAALRSFCQEFSEQQKVDVDFQTDDLPILLPPDVSLCLFRILQEALHNSAKHSGVRHFEVRLWETSDAVHLTVRDSGAGFDLETAKRGRGLGLVSMEERLKVLNGTLSIESLPQRGTAIHAHIPLTSGSDSMRAAG